jgi:arabinose-5-phosphate isomerase
MNQYVKSALRVIDIEKNAVAALADACDDNFVEACNLLLECEGRIVVTGMGKSGHIANKIAATLASTGTPAFYVHPGEASHGDLGMFKQQDVVLALSNSGETGEIVTLLPVLKRIGCPIISMTGNPTSSLASNSNIHLHVNVKEEACPLGLAPTASTTASLVLGDALAVTLLEARGFTAEDFALSHPGGALGRKLLLTNKDIMHSGERIPLVNVDATLKEAIIEMSAKGLGMTGIVDQQGLLVGIFTDGDLRRWLDHKDFSTDLNIAKVMTTTSVATKANILAAETLAIMDKHKINGLFVLDDKQKPVGAINMHDLLKAGVL